MRLKLLLLSLCISILTSCVTVRDYQACSVAGKLAEGGFCADAFTSVTFDLTEDEMLDFMESQADRTCVPVPGTSICADDQTTGTPEALPARGPAILLSSAQFGEIKTELEAACRELGSRCKESVRSLLKSITKIENQFSQEKLP